MSKLIQPKPETTEDLSIDKLEAAVKTNKDLYDELNKLTEFEAVDPFDSDQEESFSVQEEQKAVSVTFLKLKNIYLENDLFRYAIWSILLMLLSTTILTIVEYDMFQGDVSGDIGESFRFGDTEPNWLDTFFHTFWWSVVTFTTVGYLSLIHI